MTDNFLVGLRLSVVIFYAWLFVLSLRYYEDKQKFYAGAAMYAAIVLFFAPEHLARLTGHAFPYVISGGLLVAANICLLISAWLSIGLLTERADRATTKRVV
ncbi:hypothetical protein, partial [Parasphingorhabdus sp.]|uniref:hypothetical protein n=1 Tax=Parasphingorhabdus sp. TaxID=2709688 RepID=UPI003299D392